MCGTFGCGLDLLWGQAWLLVEGLWGVWRVLNHLRLLLIFVQQTLQSVRKNNKVLKNYKIKVIRQYQDRYTSQSPANFCHPYPCCHFSLSCLPGPPSFYLSFFFPPLQEVCCGRRWCSPELAGASQWLLRGFLLMFPAHSTLYDTVHLWQIQQCRLIRSPGNAQWHFSVKI